MMDRVIEKLEKLALLDGDDRARLAALPNWRVRHHKAKTEILRAGDMSNNVIFVLSGWLTNAVVLEDGRRQIVSLPIEGDICELAGTVSGEAASSLTVLTAASTLAIPRRALLAVLRASQALSYAFFADVLTDASIRREWIINTGRRSATERLGHLMCELFYRQHAIGRTIENRCALPLTQTELADVTGMTPVHINRTLQEMRAQGHIALRRRELVIRDFAELARVSMFDPNYLYLTPLAGGRSDGSQVDPPPSWLAAHLRRPDEPRHRPAFAPSDPMATPR